MSGVRRHLTYANVVATVALFAVLGGGAWAAAKIGTGDIKNGAVTTKKLAKAAVATKKLEKNAVTGKKVDESSLGTVPTAAIARSPLAYAHVTAGGNVIEADSRGVTDANVSESPIHAGVYCFTGLGEVESAMAVGENVEGDVGLPNVFEDGAPGFCPERQLMVGMTRSSRRSPRPNSPSTSGSSTDPPAWRPRRRQSSSSVSKLRSRAPPTSPASPRARGSARSS